MRPPPSHDSRPPPGSWAPAHAAVSLFVRPIEAFLHTEAASGVVLLFAAVIAIVWANSPLAGSYHALWEIDAGFEIGELSYHRPLHFWVNEVLMTLFFFVVGLEIRREIARGELSDRRRAALPLAAALGGMVVPALLYLAFNAGTPHVRGWAVPMATDIAFAVGVLALLGKRVPPALRILLLALAVIDDVGAIVVIGTAYSSGFQPVGIAIALAGVALILLMQRAGLRRAWLYVPAGLLVWEGVHTTGVHATLAGVIVGLLTPARAWFGPREFVSVVGGVVDALDRHSEAPDAVLGEQLPALDRARRELMAPLDLVQSSLHPWVAFLIMPLFAFANAGVTLGELDLDAEAVPVIGGIVVGLVVGKPLGIVLGAWLAVKAGAAALPRGVSWRGVGIVGCVGGIGFTMSLFIAELAFDAADLSMAKLAILAGTGIAGLLGLVAGRAVLAPLTTPVATASEAEASTQD